MTPCAGSKLSGGRVPGSGHRVVHSVLQACGIRTLEGEIAQRKAHQRPPSINERRRAATTTSNHDNEQRRQHERQRATAHERSVNTPFDCHLALRPRHVPLWQDWLLATGMREQHTVHVHCPSTLARRRGTRWDLVILGTSVEEHASAYVHCLNTRGRAWS